MQYFWYRKKSDVVLDDLYYLKVVDRPAKAAAYEEFHQRGNVDGYCLDVFLKGIATALRIAETKEEEFSVGYEEKEKELSKKSKLEEKRDQSAFVVGEHKVISMTVSGCDERLMRVRGL